MTRNHTINQLNRNLRALVKSEFFTGELELLTVTGPFHKLHGYRTSVLAWANRAEWVLETTLHRPRNVFDALASTTATLQVKNGGPLYVKERKHPQSTGDNT